MSKPCLLQIRHSAPVRGSPLIGVAARGQELTVWLPELAAAMESRPFSVLTDVIGNLMLGKLRVVEPGPARPHESVMSAQNKSLHVALQMAVEADTMDLGMHSRAFTFRDKVTFTLPSTLYLMFFWVNRTFLACRSTCGRCFVV